MLKWIFWLLLSANGVLFALHQGYLGQTTGERREAGRMAIQLHTDQIKLLSESSARATVAPLFDKPAAVPPGADKNADKNADANAETAASKSESVTAMAANARTDAAACIEIGSFSTADAQRFQAQLTALGLKAKSTVRSVAAEAASYMVYLPPPDKNAQESAPAELRQLGINDFFVLPQASPLHGGISLGIFKTEEGAKTQLANLTKKGVRNARIDTRGAAGGQQQFQLHGLARDEQRAFDRLRAEFPEQKTQACDAAGANGRKAGGR